MKDYAAKHGLSGSDLGLQLTQGPLALASHFKRTPALAYALSIFAFFFCVTTAARGQGLASFWNGKEGSEHVFFVGSDEQVHELYYIHGRWHHGSTGAALNARPVYPSSPLVAFFDGFIQHVFYVATVPDTNYTSPRRALLRQHRVAHWASAKRSIFRSDA
jgi:hypothetical protein